METNTEKIAKNLNALVEKNSDAEKGFAKAAEICKAKSLTDWFNGRTEERKLFKGELTEEIHSFGYPCVQTPSLTGDLHRAWMDLKASFSDDNEKAMLEEAIRGEKAALKEYNEVLGEVTLPATTQILLKSHRAKIENGLSMLRSLDDIEFQDET